MLKIALGKMANWEFSKLVLSAMVTSILLLTKLCLNLRRAVSGFLHVKAARSSAGPTLLIWLGQAHLLIRIILIYFFLINYGLLGQSPTTHPVGLPIF